MVESEQLWQEVLDLRWACLGSRSIHKLHLIQLEQTISVNLRLWLHGQLVLKPKHPRKMVNRKLIQLLCCHPLHFLPINIEEESSIELTDNFLIPIILEAHHLGHF
jgi:hypothetical protein